MESSGGLAARLAGWTANPALPAATAAAPEAAASSRQPPIAAYAATVGSRAGGLAGSLATRLAGHGSAAPHPAASSAASSAETGAPRPDVSAAETAETVARWEEQNKDEWAACTPAPEDSAMVPADGAAGLVPVLGHERADTDTPLTLAVAEGRRDGVWRSQLLESEQAGASVVAALGLLRKTRETEEKDKGAADAIKVRQKKAKKTST